MENNLIIIISVWLTHHLLHYVTQSDRALYNLKTLAKIHPMNKL